MRKQLEELQCSFDWDRVSKSVYRKRPYITRLGALSVLHSPERKTSLSI